MRPAVPIGHSKRSLLIQKDALRPDIAQNCPSFLVLPLGFYEAEEQEPQFLFAEEVFFALPVVDLIAEEVRKVRVEYLNERLVLLRSRAGRKVLPC